MRALARVLGVVATLVAIGSNLAFAQTTKTLVCRGTTVTTYGTGMQFMSWLRDDNCSVRVYFQKGTTAYSVDALKPGQCTWFDQGMSSDDPATMRQTVTYPYWDSGNFIGYGTIYLSTGGIAAAKIPYFPMNITGAMVEAQIAASGTLFDSNTYYTFDVYNDGREFIIVSAAPFPVSAPASH